MSHLVRDSNLPATEGLHDEARTDWISRTATPDIPGRGDGPRTDLGDRQIQRSANGIARRPPSGPSNQGTRRVRRGHERRSPCNS
jgi:hypothetical protein